MKLACPQTTQRCLRINRRQISLLKFILEGYDNMATLTTLDAAAGMVVVRIAVGCEEDVDHLLAHLQESIYMEYQNQPVAAGS